MKNLYENLPIPLQNLACSLYGYKERRNRYGTWFLYYQNLLKQTDYFNKKEIEDYQNQKLRETLINAYENIPYYRQLFFEKKLKPRDIQKVADLKSLPILTKEIIFNNHELFINKKISKNKIIKSKTSGTTGTSLKFYSTREAISFQWAVWWRHRSRFGFNFGIKHLNFTGKTVVPFNQITPPYWRWNTAFNQALLPMQSISPGKVKSINDFILKNKFDYWVGYPSIIHNFCSLLIEQKISLLYKPKVIFFGAENIFDYQRADIEKVTGALLTDQYGFSEGAGNASQCEFHNHHIDFEFGILECFEPKVIENGDKVGKIIGTGFTNQAFPFIRYDIGDLGVWAADDYKCQCGRESQVIKKIEGRVDDYIITPEGSKIMRFDYIFKDTKLIKEAQVVQKEMGSIVINVVRKEGYFPAIENHVKSMVKKYISPKLKVSFNYVNHISREKNGKFRAVKSELNNSHYKK